MRSELATRRLNRPRQSWLDRLEALDNRMHAEAASHAYRQMRKVPVKKAEMTVTKTSTPDRGWAWRRVVRRRMEDLRMTEAELCSMIGISVPKLRLLEQEGHGTLWRQIQQPLALALRWSTSELSVWIGREDELMRCEAAARKQLNDARKIERIARTSTGRTAGRHPEQRTA